MTALKVITDLRDDFTETSGYEFVAVSPPGILPVHRLVLRHSYVRQMRHFARLNLINLAQQVDIYMNSENYTETEGCVKPRL